MKAIIFISLLLALSACSGDDKATTKSQEKGEPVNGIRIAWDYSSLQQIADIGCYNRLLRLNDNSIMAIYETRTGDIEYRRSHDNGVSWSVAIKMFSRIPVKNEKGETNINMSNPEIIQLQNGDLIVACNYRPQKEEIVPYSIVIRRSTDNGATWLAPQIIYNAAPRFKDGCWEPSFLQLPNGEVQVYFANENPYQSSEEQEISMLSSLDNGVTWTDEIKTVSFRADRRDGMPVPAIIGDEIVVVIEDNNIDQFKPYTVRTKIADNWSQPVLANSPNRECAFAPSENVSDKVYMGAPYIIKLPTGETVISYQSTQNRTTEWELSTMEVAIGDKAAKNFTKRSYPIDVPLDKEAKWNSIAVWDANTVVAFPSTNFKSANVSPWIIMGHIIPEIKAQQTVSTYPIFIGAKGSTNMRAGIAADNTNIYVKCKVNDDILYQESANSKSDGVYVYIDSENTSLKGPDKGAYKLWCDYKGNAALWEGKGGNWNTASANNIKATAVTTTSGYDLEITIPKTIFPALDKNAIRLGMALSAYNSSLLGYTEQLINSIEDAPNTWLEVKF